MSEIHAAVIFDVDGPLLHLLPAEEQAFFAPFKEVHGLTGLSNDWDSYKTRNDEDIILEILEGHFGRTAERHELEEITTTYAKFMERGYADGSLVVEAVPGALDLLQKLHAAGGIALGTATANVLHAAQVRLTEAGMWDYVQHHPGAADGGGAKREVLRRTIEPLGLPPERVVFLGDNLNDLDAGQANGVNFIGFHVAEHKRQRLIDHGAEVVFGDHSDTHSYIVDLLGL